MLQQVHPRGRVRRVPIFSLRSNFRADARTDDRRSHTSTDFRANARTDDRRSHTATDVAPPDAETYARAELHDVPVRATVGDQGAVVVGPEL